MQKRVTIKQKKNMKFVSIETNHAGAFRLGFELAKIYWASWWLITLAVIGAGTIIFILSELRFYEIYAKTFYETTIYSASGLKVELAGKRIGTWESTEIPEKAYEAQCPKPGITKFLWLYEKICEEQ